MFSIRNERSRGGRRRSRRIARHGRRLHGRPVGRGPKDVGHGRAAAGDQDHRAVAGRAQRPLLDAGQASGRRRDSPLHPVFGAHVRGHQTVDGGGEPHAAARPRQDHDGPVAANHAKGRVRPCVRRLRCVMKLKVLFSV